LHLFCTCFA